MGQPIVEPKMRADLSFEVQQRVQWTIDMLRILKDSKDGLLPDGGQDPTNSRVGRVRETVWSLYEDLLRSGVELIIACNHDALGLVTLLRGGDVSEPTIRREAHVG